MQNDAEKYAYRVELVVFVPREWSRWVFREGVGRAGRGCVWVASNWSRWRGCRALTTGRPTAADFPDLYQPHTHHQSPITHLSSPHPCCTTCSRKSPTLCFCHTCTSFPVTFWTAWQTCRLSYNRIIWRHSQNVKYRTNSSEDVLKNKWTTFSWTGYIFCSVVQFWTELLRL